MIIKNTYNIYMIFKNNSKQLERVPLFIASAQIYSIRYVHYRYWVLAMIERSQHVKIMWSKRNLRMRIMLEVFISRFSDTVQPMMIHLWKFSSACPEIIEKRKLRDPFDWIIDFRYNGIVLSAKKLNSCKINCIFAERGHASFALLNGIYIHSRIRYFIMFCDYARNRNNSL